MKQIIINIIILLVIFVFAIYSHEESHVVAYETLGYYDNNLVVSHEGIYVENHDTISAEDASDIYKANMMIDAITYNLFIPLMAILAILLAKKH